jgi:hypothetical protein
MNTLVHCLSFLSLQSALQDDTIHDVSMQGTIVLESTIEIHCTKMLWCKSAHPCILDFSNGHRIVISEPSSQLTVQAIRFVNGYWDSKVPSRRFGNVLIENGGSMYTMYCTFENNTYIHPALDHSGSVASVYGDGSVLSFHFSKFKYHKHSDLAHAVRGSLGATVQYQNTEYIYTGEQRAISSNQFTINIVFIILSCVGFVWVDTGLNILKWFTNTIWM